MFLSAFFISPRRAKLGGVTRGMRSTGTPPPPPTPAAGAPPAGPWQELSWQFAPQRLVGSMTPRGYGWTGQQPGSGFCDLAPSILHYNWF
jgi:hypothetical protein